MIMLNSDSAKNLSHFATLEGLNAHELTYNATNWPFYQNPILELTNTATDHAES